MGAQSAPVIMAPTDHDRAHDQSTDATQGTQGSRSVETRATATTTSAVPVSEAPSLVDISVPATPAAIPAGSAPNSMPPTAAVNGVHNGGENQQHEIGVATTQAVGVGGGFISLLASLPQIPTQAPNGQGQDEESNAETQSISDTSSVSLVSGENSRNSVGFAPQTTAGGQMMLTLPGFQQMFGQNGQGMFTLFPGSLFGFGFGGAGRQIRPKAPHDTEISRHKGPMNIRMSHRELLDDAIYLFVSAVSPHIEKVVGVRANIDSYIEAVAKAKHILENDHGELSQAQKDEFNESIEIFNEKLAEEVKHMTWIKSALFTSDRQALAVALLKTVLASLKQSSALGLLFRFTPDVYISALVKLTTLLLIQMHPTMSHQRIPGFQVLCREIAEFIALHFVDARIPLSETKDTLTLALNKFMCDRTMLTAIETMPDTSQVDMVKSLLKPYENRAWAQSNWMLVRMWQGNGFGFQYLNCASARKSYRTKGAQDEFGISTDLPPTPSAILQAHVKTILLADQTLATSYIHSLLNQLNWSFSEFIGLLQEVNNAASQTENVYFDHRQLKVCCTCFELTQALLRVVEMIISIASPVFTDFGRENAEHLLERLCMLLSQVLNRVASSSGTFGQVVDLEVPGLDTITYYAMLSSVAGILVTLLRDEVKITDATRLPITKTIILEPSMQINCLDFLIGESHAGAGTGTGHHQQEHPFTLRNYVPGDITPAEMHDLEITVAHLKRWNGEFQRETDTISDDDICTICYAYRKSTTMLPCNHRACQACIAHHLLNKHQCFFCKRKIEKVMADDGTVVYENTPDPDEVAEAARYGLVLRQGGPAGHGAPGSRDPSPPPHDNNRHR